MEINVPPESFNFPYKPYDVQTEFMKNMYSSLENGKIGIFESPTGTGKSLSIICGAITWLKEYENRRKIKLEKELGEAENHTEDGNDWFTIQTKEKAKQVETHDLRTEYEFLKSQENKTAQLKAKIKRRRSEDDKELKELIKSAKLIKTNKENSTRHSETNDSESDDEFLPELQESVDTLDDKEEDISHHITKIYYCSRTHSQLSQFVHEVQKSSYGKDVRVVTLGSRQNMCINEAVQKLQSLSLINDRCLDLQKKKDSKKPLSEREKSKKSSSGCPYHRQHPMSELRDAILAEVKDIEEIVTVAKDYKACPYYSSRHGIPDAELVVVPYNVLLHRDTRKACGINLKDNVVIIDEAHNLLETINNIYSATITGMHASHAYIQLKHYLERYHSRLNPQNLMYIKQILFILSALVKQMGGSVNCTPSAPVLPAVSVHHQNDFLSIVAFDNINLFNVLKYCEDSKIARKLHGFSNKHSVSTKQEVKTSSLTKYLEQLQNQMPDKKDDKNDQVQEVIMGSPLLAIIEFLKALTNPSKAGRVILNKNSAWKQSSLTFLLLNPSLHFEDIVSEARSVILAGGTMHPISEFVEQLFIPAGVPRERIERFSCGHVIPDENLLTISLTAGPGGSVMDFTYNNRNNQSLMDDLGRLLVNISAVVPGGVVCFFPSYEYEQQVYNYWEKSGVILRLNGKKRVFREPKKSNLVEKVLSDYAKAIRNKSQIAFQNGAMLFSIVGGKMSEGINFSDDLGRCVVMVGLPYPNIRSPELKEKVDYLNSTLPSGTDGRKPGNFYCDNLCMRAVNQSIGRAIRHLNDYATILLLDSRYQRSTIESSLPQWIASGLQRHNKFGLAFSAIRQFFLKKRQI